MRKVILLLCLCHAASAVTHSLKYFYTGSTGVPNFPEFVTVGLVDEVVINHYDSNTRRNEPKQDWMRDAVDPQFWETQTENSKGAQQVYKSNLEVAKQRFNQTGDVHIFQIMYGCEWDDETEEVKGSYQYGYDGEDFITYDLETETWVAPKRQGFITKHKWDHDKALIAQLKHYLTQICPEYLKKYVNYGRSVLLRTELPSVSLVQKTPSSPVSCHATGFYPDRATLFWRKDGEELHEDVDLGEILPNHDGTFQMRVDLKLSSAEDRTRYDCVFQLSGVKDDLVTRLDKESNGAIFIIAAVVLLALVLIAVIGFVIYKKKNAKCPPSPVNNAEVLEKLNPESERKSVNNPEVKKLNPGSYVPMSLPCSERQSSSSISSRESVVSAESDSSTESVNSVTPLIN